MREPTSSWRPPLVLPLKEEREPSGAGKTAAAEEAVLVLVGRRFAVRLDECDLGKRRLHCRPLVDGVEPALEVRVVLPLHALRVMIARPRKGRDICDRIVVAAEIRHLP